MSEDEIKALESYTYYAFVSYSHKDEKWGRWIQTALERYRLPAAVRKEVGKPLPQRIHPVFRDDTDLGAGRLENNLRQELEQSRYLIVVCSPNSAKPNAEGRHWVDEEVARFCEMDRTDRVIPVIVAGTAETSFCPKIREEGLLGLDATSHSRSRILNDIVAKILGLRPDALWRREERRLRAWRRWRSFAAALAVSFVTLGGYIAWDCTRTVTRFFADYVDSYGLPEGIFPLKEDELKHRHRHYRFEFRGIINDKSPHADSARRSIWNVVGLRRRLVRVVQANASGYPCDLDYVGFPNRPQIQDFSYVNSQLREIRNGLYSGEGQEPVLEKRVEFHDDKGAVNGIISFFSGETQRSIDYEGSEGNKSRAMQCAVQRDSAGRVINQIFYDPSFLPTRNADGVYGYYYKHDMLGRQVEKWYLYKGKDAFISHANQHGIAGCSYKYEGSSLRQITFLGEKTPVVGDDGWSSCLYSYDSFGNLIDCHFEDIADNPCLCADGYASIHLHYDENYDIETISFLDESGHPTFIKEGYCSIKHKTDKLSNVTEVHYLDSHGGPASNKMGVSSIVRHYDSLRNVTNVTFNGLLEGMIPNQGVVEERCEYEHGSKNIKRISYYDKDGKPIANKEGFAEKRIEAQAGFDGDVLTIRYFDEKKEPVLIAGGYAMLKVKLDERKNVQNIICFGTDGKPRPNNRKITEKRFGYNDSGMKIEESYFDANGEAVLDADGVSIRRFDYDNLGNMTEKSYYASEGKLTLCDGIAKVLWSFDENGNMTNETYRGVDGNPISNSEGVAEKRVKYDGQGRIVSVSMFGIGGNPIADIYNVHKYRYKYDDRGNKIATSCYGTDRKPANVDVGDGIFYSTVQMRYSVFGELRHMTYMDKAGNIVMDFDVTDDETEEEE